MVSEDQSRKILSLGSKRNHGVTKKASNRSLKKMINALRVEDLDSLVEFLREKINQGGRSGARSLELRFVNDDMLPDMTFTKTNIIPKGESLGVVLFDVRSNSIVNEGPFSSIKIRICPIFGAWEDEDWTEVEFKDNILRERENKEPLLDGDKVISLKNGVASISTIMFNDNSSWVRTKKFSLGVKAMKNGEIIKEGKSQALIWVKDFTGKSYKQHNPPYLKKIAKNGPFHKQLQEHLFSRDKINEVGKSGARSLELRFANDDKLPDTTFTKTNIIPKDEALQVALFDVRSNSIVNDGPLSSIKIQICPIKSVFESCDDEDWTEAEFSDNILHERENKEPLLVGDRFVTLKNGVASISKITFTDNSGWERDKKFRLGAKAMKNGEIIKEGRSQALIRVKDGRGEYYKKHYPPYLKDDVWRLNKIAKNGPFHKRLHDNEIHTVKDLLRLLITNESSLQKYSKIQKKCWLAIVEHARSCVVDDYVLYGYEMIGQPVWLLFNVIYELVGVTFGEQKFYLPDDLTLTPNQKNLVEIVKKDAYKNIENLKAIDEGTLNSISLEACIKSTQDLQGYVEPFIPSSNVNDGMQNVQINIDPVAETREIPQNNYGDSTYAVIPELDYDVSFSYFDGAELSTFLDF